MTSDEFDQRMQQWRDAEEAAKQARDDLRNLGQATSDPALAGMYRDAAALQRAADELLSSLIALLNPRRP